MSGYRSAPHHLASGDARGLARLLVLSHAWASSFATDPRTHFFLSCDDAATERQIRETIPNVTSLAAKGGFNTVDGVRAAVADLYLLAGSTHLLGPYWSSFVELAWILGGRSQVLENSVHRFDPQGALHRQPRVGEDVRPTPSELFVRNPLLVAWDRMGARRRAQRVAA